MLKSLSGKTNLSKGKVIVAIVVVLGLAGVLFFGTRESEITLQNGMLKISGMYGVEISTEAIESVTLREEIPAVRNKVNALSVFSLKKGTFRMDEIEQARLFLHSNNGPYIQITTEEEIMIVNFQNPEKTRSVYEEISHFR